MSPEEHKRLIKEAFKEAAADWMSEKFRQFGKWSLGALGAAGIVALTYFILLLNGWKAPH